MNYLKLSKSELFVGITSSAFLDSKSVGARRFAITVAVQNKSGSSVLDQIAAILSNPETELLVGVSSDSLLGETGSAGGGLNSQSSTTVFSNQSSPRSINVIHSELLVGTSVPRVNNEVGAIRSAAVFNIHDISVRNAGDLVEARGDEGGGGEGSSKK